jgi:hypothetical protein
MDSGVKDLKQRTGKPWEQCQQAIEATTSLAEAYDWLNQQWFDKHARNPDGTIALTVAFKPNPYRLPRRHLHARHTRTERHIIIEPNPDANFDEVRNAISGYCVRNKIPCREERIKR